jgi:hypothetical protein
MEAWWVKIEAWKACRPVNADSHYLDESRIRIRINVKS